MSSAQPDPVEIVRAIGSNAEARGELVRIVVGDELRLLRSELAETHLEIDQRIADVDTRLAQLTERMDTLAERMDTLAKRMADLAEAQAQGHREMNRLNGVVGKVLGEVMENRYALYAPAHFSPIAVGLEELTRRELHAVLREAESQGRIVHDELLDAHRIDLVFRGNDARDGRDVVLAVEVSSVTDKGDVERAARRADVLRRAGLDVVAAVAGTTATRGAIELAAELGVWRVLDGEAFAPAA